MSLKRWLDKIQSEQTVDMNLSLERVKEVASRLKLLNPRSKVITVGGTNGKGSCVAALEAIYLENGYSVGAFTSPILIQHNEYVRLMGKNATDEQFCNAYERIESVRGEIALTSFEFTTLAAFEIFYKANLDIWILEVGLGGRFDATNIMDSDLAIIASIGIDHTEWLGDTRELIGYEKAGIFRKNKPAVCGDMCPPATLIDYANKIGADLYCQGQQFSFESNSTCWTWWSETSRLTELPLSQLALQNMSTVLMAIELLQKELPVAHESIPKVLGTVALSGRLQVFPGDVTVVCDVSHNPASAAFLARWLEDNPCEGKTHAVFSMLADKDCMGTIQVIKEWVDHWYVAGLPVKRGASVQQLISCFQKLEIKSVTSCDSIKEAFLLAKSLAKSNKDRIVVFGSFHTVAEVLVFLKVDSGGYPISIST